LRNSKSIARSRALRKEDAARLIAAADGKLKLLLVFLFLQGWRISDALRLRWQDINLRETNVQYHVSKTDDWLTVPLHTTVLDMFRNEAPGIGRVFPWGSKRAFYRVLKPLCEKTGIYFTPHMARHSFGTWLGHQGASTKEIMEPVAGGTISPSCATSMSMSGASGQQSIAYEFRCKFGANTGKLQ
jgi:integrase